MDNNDRRLGDNDLPEDKFKKPRQVSAMRILKWAHNADLELDDEPAAELVFRQFRAGEDAVFRLQRLYTHGRLPLEGQRLWRDLQETVDAYQRSSCSFVSVYRAYDSFFAWLIRHYKLESEEIQVDDSSFGPRDREVYKFIDDVPKTQKELETLSKLPEGTVKTATTNLREAGLIINGRKGDKEGYYKV